MKKILLTMLLGIFLLSFASAISELDEVGQGECIDLYQYCDDCTYVNLTAIKYPGGEVDTSLNEEMTKVNQNFNYTFCGTNNIGDHFYIVCGDKFGSYKCEEIKFEVTPNGLGQNLGFYIIWILLSIGIIVLGYYSQDQWVVVLGSFILVLFGLYVLFYGIAGVKDAVYTWGIGITTLMLGLYFGIRGSMEGL